MSRPRQRNFLSVQVQPRGADYGVRVIGNAAAASERYVVARGDMDSTGDFLIKQRVALNLESRIQSDPEFRQEPAPGTCRLEQRQQLGGPCAADVRDRSFLEGGNCPGFDGR